MSAWVNQLDYIFFLYGLAFIALATVCFAHRKCAPPDFQCCWLAVFAIAHGLNEWLDMLALSLIDSAAFQSVRLAVLAFSFLALLEFARRHMQSRSRIVIWIGVYVILSALAATGVWLDDAEAGFVSVRIFLGLPAAWCAAWVMWTFGGSPGRGAPVAWRLAAFALFVYGILTGFVVPPSDLLPAVWPDRAEWLRVVRIPVEVFRALAAILLAGAVWRIYRQEWEERVGRYMAGVNVRGGLATIVVLVAILLLGATITQVVGDRREQRLRRDIIRTGRALAEAVNIERVRTMTDADQVRLHAQLRGMAEVHPVYRRLFIAGRKEGRWSILVDSKAKMPPDTPPLELVAPHIVEAWERRTGVILHRHDGAVIETAVPLLAPGTREPIAVFVVDVDHAYWHRELSEARLMGIGMTLLLSLLVLGSYVLSRYGDENRWGMLLRLALDGGDLAIWDWNVRTGFIVFDERYGQLLGYSADEVSPIIGGWEALLHPDDHDEVMRLLAAHLEGRTERYEAEYRIRHKSGEWIWFLDRGRVIDRSAAGNPLRCAGTFTDITRRKQVEQKEREAESTYRDLINNVTDAVYIQDEHGVFLDVNRAAERIYGYTRDEMVGRTPEFLSAPDRNDEETVARCVERAFAGTPQRFEFWGRRRDGSVFPKDVSVSPGTYFGQRVAIAVARDITERKRAEQIRMAIYELGEQAGQASSFQAFCGQAHRIVQSLIPAENLYVAVRNDETSWIDFPYFKDGKDAVAQSRPPAKRLTDYVLETGHSIRWSAPGTVDHLHAAGYEPLGTCAEDWIGIPLKREGCPIGIMAVQDYSPGARYMDEDVRLMEQIADKVAAILLQFRVAQERAVLERRLQQAQKLESLGLMAGGVAHDFNNLLMAILGNLELAAQDAEPGSPVRMGIDDAAHAARRAADITRQILAYSGKGTVYVGPLDLNDMVRDNRNMLKTVIPKNIELALHLHDQIPDITGDAGQIQQILMNLITNAAEAIGDLPGAIRISTGTRWCDKYYLSTSRLEDSPTPGAYVWLEVTDTGCGMAPDVRERIFDPFFSTKFTGRGLGLSATLGIVRGHHGAIMIETQPGQGCTVRLLFPVVRAMTKTDQPEVVPPAPDRPYREADPARVVLVIEDEPAVRKLCENAITRSGYAVLTAPNGRKGIEVFQQNQDRIVGVLLDLTMPEMDGAATLKALQERVPDLPIIMCSGYSEQEAMRRTQNAAPQAFIQKPFDLDSLRTLMESIFG